MGFENVNVGWMGGLLKSFQAEVNARLKRVETAQPYMRRGKPVSSRNDWRPVTAELIDENGRLLLKSSSIVTQGSVSPNITDVGFTVVPEANAATLYWDGTNGSSLITIRRPDQTRITLPGGNIRISGLASTTTYWIYPFWSPSNQCTIGFVLGTVGTPQFCFSGSTADGQAQQNLIGREGLGSLNFTTTAGGTGPSGPPGGRTCVMLGTDIEPIDDAEYQSVMLPQSEWWCISVPGKRSVNVVPTHRFYDPLGNPKEAKDFQIGDWIVMRDGDYQVSESYPFIRVCTKVQVKMKRVHLYWANEYLSHNMKIAPDH